MKLRFRIETRKIKQPRIVVLRVLEKDGKPYEKQVGSFNYKRDPEPIKKLLSPDELYEFENFLSTLKFAKDLFEKNADELDRFIIKTAPDFINALIKIFEASQNYGIEFIPEKEMLYAALNQAKTIEQQLNFLTDGQFKALSNSDIDITSINPPKKSINESQKLFKAILEANKTPESINGAVECFNKIASEKYNKNTTFTVKYLEHYATTAPNGSMPRFPKWYFTVAIDTLLELGIKPYKVITPALMIKHWLRLNKKKTEKETFKAFAEQFHQFTDSKLCENMIKKSFMEDLLRQMGDFSDNATPSPSLAVNKWLDNHLKSHKNVSATETCKAFGSEFPSLTNNDFCLQIINKRRNN